MGKAQMHQVGKTWSVYDQLPMRTRSLLKRLWSKLGFSRPFGTLLRFEFDMALLRLWCLCNVFHRQQVRKLRQRRGLKLHLGCGNAVKPGWVNVDCYPPKTTAGCEMLVCDVRQGLPFTDESASAVYSEHFLEHIPFDIAKYIVAECFRILAPGGHIRMGVPDGELYVGQYDSGEIRKGSSLAAHIPRRYTAMMVINDIAHGGGHLYLYDYKTLEVLFREAGFERLRKAKANDSDLICFRDVDQKDEFRTKITVYIEGLRPLNPALSFRGRNSHRPSGSV